MSNRQSTPETYGSPAGFTGQEQRRHASQSQPAQDEESNDHLASIYETRDEQFAAIVPFIRNGIERNERCLYVADENSEAEVLKALREGGIDVDRACDRDALTIMTKDESYLRTGEFDPDAMLDFWQEVLGDARDDRGFAGVRAAAEKTWAIDEEVGLDELVRYEALLNTIYPGDDYVVLCQYNRTRFPTDVLSDVIRSHPFVVYDGTACRNFYYHPPDDFFGVDHPTMDVDRTVEGLVNHARTQHALDDRERQLHDRLRQQEVVADLGQAALKDPNLDELFEQATERLATTLDADYAAVFDQLPRDALLVRAGVGWQDDVVGAVTVAAEGSTLPASALRSTEPIVVEELSTDDRYESTDLLADHDVTSGISVLVGHIDDPWGVLSVQASKAREFSQHDAAFVRSVANTIASAIERNERDRYQRRLYAVTSNPDLAFDEKLRAVFDLGCDYYDMDIGGIAQIDPVMNRFTLTHTNTDHEQFSTGLVLPLEDTYCVTVADGDRPVGIADATSAGHDDAAAYREFGIEAYLGTRIEVDGDHDRTFFFVSFDARNQPFTDGERAFLHLMGQWLQNELDRPQYQRRLEASNERLEQFAYAASHDLQEPLRMVSSYLQLLEQRYTDRLDDDGEEFIAFAVDGATRMSEMINGLLEYSRIETRGDPFRETDLEAVIEDVMTDLQLRIEDSDASVTVEELPTVHGDPSQLRQVFQNLLENAIEYAGDEPAGIRISAEQAGSEWLLKLRDEGIGIPADHHDRVFEVFERLHTQEEHPGTGIGLSVCQRIVERHGGTMWIDSEPKEGATVSFTIARTDE